MKVDYLAPLLHKNIPGRWRRGGGVRFGSTAELVRQREASVVLIVIRAPGYRGEPPPPPRTAVPGPAPATPAPSPSRSDEFVVPGRRRQ